MKHITTTVLGTYNSQTCYNFFYIINLVLGKKSRISALNYTYVGCSIEMFAVPEYMYYTLKMINAAISSVRQHSIFLITFFRNEVAYKVTDNLSRACLWRTNLMYVFQTIG